MRIYTQRMILKLTKYNKTIKIIQDIRNYFEYQNQIETDNLKSNVIAIQ